MTEDNIVLLKTILIMDFSLWCSAWIQVGIHGSCQARHFIGCLWSLTFYPYHGVMAPFHKIIPMNPFCSALCLACGHSSWCTALSLPPTVPTPPSLPPFLPLSFYLFLLPSWCFRKLAHQGLPSPNPITLWNLPLPSLPPFPPCPMTAPPGYTAWASMMVTLMMKTLTSERYLGYMRVFLSPLHPVSTVVETRLLKTPP